MNVGERKNLPRELRLVLEDVGAGPLYCSTVALYAPRTRIFVDEAYMERDFRSILSSLLAICFLAWLGVRQPILWGVRLPNQLSYPLFCILISALLLVVRRVSGMLQDLDLFGEPTSSALTFLRIFTARSYMLDVEVIFGGRKVPCAPQSLHLIPERVLRSM